MGIDALDARDEDRLNQSIGMEGVEPEDKKNRGKEEREIGGKGENGIVTTLPWKI